MGRTQMACPEIFFSIRFSFFPPGYPLFLFQKPLAPSVSIGANVIRFFMITQGWSDGLSCVGVGAASFLGQLRLRSTMTRLPFLFLPSAAPFFFAESLFFPPQN